VRRNDTYSRNGLIRTADLNDKLRLRGCEASVKVQRVCRVSQDEEEVRDVLDRIWESPDSAIALLNKVALSNQRIFDLEQKLATPTVIAGQVRAAAVVLSDVASPTR
jgi:hypothetical protein